MLEDFIRGKHPDLAEDCIKVLQQYKNKLIDERMFHAKLYLISVDHPTVMADLTFQTPPLAPTDVMDFRSLGDKDKKDFLDKDASFFTTGAAGKYMAEFSRVEGKNQRNKKYLKEMRASLLKDPDRLEKVDNALRSYGVTPEENDLIKDLNEWAE